jgi:hypothetical protein
MQTAFRVGAECKPAACVWLHMHIVPYPAQGLLLARPVGAAGSAANSAECSWQDIKYSSKLKLGGGGGGRGGERGGGERGGKGQGEKRWRGKGGS